MYNLSTRLSKSIEIQRVCGLGSKFRHGFTPMPDYKIIIVFKLTRNFRWRVRIDQPESKFEPGEGIKKFRPSNSASFCPEILESEGEKEEEKIRSPRASAIDHSFHKENAFTRTCNHKLYNIRRCNKVDHPPAIHLFLFLPPPWFPLALFLFCLPSLFSSFPPLLLYEQPKNSRRFVKKEPMLIYLWLKISTPFLSRETLLWKYSRKKALLCIKLLEFFCVQRLTGDFLWLNELIILY